MTEKGPRRCPKCQDGYIIATRRFGEKILVDRCSNCGAVSAEYTVATTRA